MGGDLKQGYCNWCGRRVLLGEDGRCPKGHPQEDLQDVRDVDGAEAERLRAGRPAAPPPPAASAVRGELASALWAYLAAMISAGAVILAGRLLGWHEAWGEGWVRFLPPLLSAAGAYVFAYWLLRQPSPAKGDPK